MEGARILYTEGIWGSPCPKVIFCSIPSTDEGSLFSLLGQARVHFAKTYINGRLNFAS